MRNLLLDIATPFALAACAADMDSDAIEEKAEEIGAADQALDTESPYPAPGGPPTGGHDVGGPGYGWPSGGCCNDPQYALACNPTRPNQSQQPRPSPRPRARSPEQLLEDAKNRVRAANDARDRIERVGASVLKTQQLKFGKTTTAEEKACRYSCNIVRASMCNDIKLACSMGIVANSFASRAGESRMPNF